MMHGTMVGMVQGVALLGRGRDIVHDVAVGLVLDGVAYTWLEGVAGPDDVSVARESLSAGTSCGLCTIA
jgi:hypothetical protein